MSLRPTAQSLLTILREINLAKLQQEAELPVRLVLYGDTSATRRLTALLGKAPWVSVIHSLVEAKADDIVLYVVSPRYQLASETGELPPQTVTVSLGETLLSSSVVLEDFEEDTLERVLAPAVLAAVSDTLKLPLARRIPLLRAAYARWLIEQTASSNAMFAASAGLAGIVPLLNIPLNVADMVVLTKNQLIMAYKLALAEGKSGKPAELMGEILSVLGGGLFFRETARKLVGFIPIWGIVPKIAVAYGGTWAIGEVVHLWAAQGKTATAKDMRQLFDKARRRGEGFARGWQVRQEKRLESTRAPSPKLKKDT